MHRCLGFGDAHPCTFWWVGVFVASVFTCFAGAKVAVVVCRFPCGFACASGTMCQRCYVPGVLTDGVGVRSTI